MFRADRLFLFLFAIIKQQSCAILFVGRAANPPREL